MVSVHDAGVAVNFINLRFECVTRPILLNIIERYGIRGVGYDLIASYLPEKKQCVEILYHGKLRKAVTSETEDLLE